MQSERVIQLSTVHPWDDVRIYHKISRSLAAAGYDVHVIAQAPEGASAEGVTLHPLPPVSSRFARVWKRQPLALKMILALKPAIVHFHDPELLLLGVMLQLNGYKVIYDAHEDVSSQVMAKHWIAPWLRTAVSKCVRVFESWAARRLSAVIGATPKITKLFQTLHTECIRNYPRLSEFEQHAELEPTHAERPAVVYVGGLSVERGIGDIVSALARTSTQVRLDVAGRFATPDFRSEVQALAGWQNVNYLGWLGREDVARTIASARVGLLTLHPTPNHLESLPIKLFEYFAAGVPVIASDFASWKELIADNGLMVPPGRPDKIAEAIDWIIDNPEEAKIMGQRGRTMVLDRCNWEQEAEKLLSLYACVLN